MENQQLLQSILNSISEGVMTLDREWRIVSWNRAAERITGFHTEDVLGKECTSVFRSRLCGKDCLLDKAISCGHPFQDLEASVYNRKNQLVHLLVSAAPLFNAKGQIIGGLETFRDVSRNYWMEAELEDHLGYKDMVGRSEAMAEVFEALASLIETDTTVLIQGESGTGKELIARALHFYGSRRDRSFVVLNCSAIPEGMLESELFGHAKGAFTGAHRDYTGKFELANGGTLFLDEIAEISPSVQVKLLRAIEEREFQRLGENKSIKVDIRLITATNQNLYKKVVEGSFREDLYYRLSVFPFNLPPLRDRVGDIRILVTHFIGKFNKHMGKRIRGIADGVLDLLESYPWPGNVRELANAIEYAFVHCKGLWIQTSDLPQRLLSAPDNVRNSRSDHLLEALESFEREFILNALEAVNWKKNEAARGLGISISTLWRRMEKYGLQRENFSFEKRFSKLTDSEECCHINSL